MTILILAILTWMELAAFSFCTAVLVFRLPGFVAPEQGETTREVFGSRIWPLFGSALAVIGAANAGLFAVGTVPSTGSPTGLPDASVATGSAVWLVRLAGLSALAAFTLGRSCRDLNQFRYLMFAAAVVYAAGRSASGNAAAGGVFTISVLADLLHLLSAAVWTGGVFVLSFIVLPALLLRGQLVLLADATRAFARLTGFAVLVILVTAVLHLRNLVGSWGALWGTDYGRLAAVKILLFYFLVLAFAFNRLVSIPLVQHLAGGRIEKPGPVGRVIQALLAHLRPYLTGPVGVLFARVLAAESVVLALLLLVSSVLSFQEPANSRELREGPRIGKTSPRGSNAAPEEGTRQALMPGRKTPGAKE